MAPIWKSKSIFFFLFYNLRGLQLPYIVIIMTEVFDYSLRPGESINVFQNIISYRELDNERGSAYGMVIFELTDVRSYKLIDIELQVLLELDDPFSNGVCIAYMYLDKSHQPLVDGLPPYPIATPVPGSWTINTSFGKSWLLLETTEIGLLWMRQFECNSRNCNFRDIIRVNQMVNPGDRLVFWVKPSHTNNNSHLSAGERTDPYLVSKNINDPLLPEYGHENWEEESSWIFHSLTKFKVSTNP